jgi:hypothetical protein
MSEKDFHGEEKLAIAAASKVAGQYLDQIGKTDLATLTYDEFIEFFERFEAARQKTLVEIMEVPF